MNSGRRFTLARRPTTWREKLWFLLTTLKWKPTVGYFVDVMPGEPAYETAEFMESIVYHSDILKVLNKK